MRVHTRIGNHETAQFNEIVFSKIVSRDDLNLPLDLNDLFYVAVLLMNSQQEAHNHLHVAFLGSHLQIANAALQASGYRTLTSKPGHHQVMIQSLSKTLGIDNDTVILLDTMRKQRNIADYSGDIVLDPGESPQL